MPVLAGLGHTPLPSTTLCLSLLTSHLFVYAGMAHNGRLCSLRLVSLLHDWDLDSAALPPTRECQARERQERPSSAAAAKAGTSVKGGRWLHTSQGGKNLPLCKVKGGPQLVALGRNQGRVALCAHGHT